MTNTLDVSLLTNAVLALLKAGMAPLEVGDGVAPTDDDGNSLITAIDIATGNVTPYLVLSNVPMGLGNLNDDWETYNAGTPSVAVTRYLIAAVGTSREQTQGVATEAAGYLADQTLTTAPTWVSGDLIVAGMEVGNRERAGAIPLDRVGELFQWGELVDIEAAVSP